MCDPDELKSTVVGEGRLGTSLLELAMMKCPRLGGLTTDTSQFLGLEVQGQEVDRVSSRAVGKDLFHARLLALSVAVLPCLSISSSLNMCQSLSQCPLFMMKPVIVG